MVCSMRLRCRMNVASRQAGTSEGGARQLRARLHHTQHQSDSRWSRSRRLGSSIGGWLSGHSRQVSEAGEREQWGWGKGAHRVVSVGAALILEPALAVDEDVTAQLLLVSCTMQ